jgi:hypothetical protein
MAKWGAFGAGISEGARVTPRRREIRRMGPKQAHMLALRCPYACTNPRTRANFPGFSGVGMGFTHPILDCFAEKGGFEPSSPFISRMFCAPLTRISFRRGETLAGKTGLRYSPVRFSIISTTGYGRPAVAELTGSPSGLSFPPAASDAPAEAGSQT